MTTFDKEPKDDLAAGDGVRKLLDLWLADEATSVAEGLLLDDDEADADIGPMPEDAAEIDDAAFARLLAVVEACGAASDAAETGGAQPGAGQGGSRPALTPIPGGASGAARAPRSRRLAAYNRGDVNIIKLATGRCVRDACVQIPAQAHMAVGPSAEDFAFDLSPFRTCLDLHVPWVGDQLLMFALDSTPLIRVTRREGKSQAGTAALVVEFNRGDGPRREVRLSAVENEMDLKLEDGDVSFADWRFSISLETAA